MKTQYKPAELGTISKLSRQLGVNVTTLTAAIAAGHVEHVILGCGQRVAVIKSAERWLETDRRTWTKGKGKREDYQELWRSSSKSTQP